MRYKFLIYRIIIAREKLAPTDSIKHVLFSDAPVINLLMPPVFMSMSYKSTIILFSCEVYDK